MTWPQQNKAQLSHDSMLSDMLYHQKFTMQSVPCHFQEVIAKEITLILGILNFLQKINRYTWESVLLILVKQLKTQDINFRNGLLILLRLT